jgi:hypothetical protein
MDEGTTPTIPLSDVAMTIKNEAKRTTEPPGKAALYRLAEGIGTKIAEHNRKFDTGQWLTQCGVDNFKPAVAA